MEFIEEKNSYATSDDRIDYAKFLHIDGSIGYLLLNPNDPDRYTKLCDLFNRKQDGELTKVETLKGYCYARYSNENSEWAHEKLSYEDFDSAGQPAAAGELAYLYEQAESKPVFVSAITVRFGPAIPRNENSAWYTPGMSVSGDF